MNRIKTGKVILMRSVSVLALASLVTMATITGVSCVAKRVDPITGAKTPATAYENVLALNASFAVVNNGFARGVVQLQDGGVIPLAPARNILAVSFKLASLDIDLTNILKEGPDAAKGKADAIDTILDQMEGLVADGILLLNQEGDKATRAQANVIALTTLLRELVGALKLAGVLT